MRQARTLTSARRASAAALIFGVLLAPTLASAKTPANTMASWRACLNGATPTTRNVPPGRYDTDPTGDELILDFADHLSDAQVKQLVAEFGLTPRLNSPHSDAANMYIARVPEGAVPAAAMCLKQRLGVDLESAEENYNVTLFDTLSREAVSVDGALETTDAPTEGNKPNDPLYQFQWHFPQVNAESAWGVSTGKGVVVAVIDTGVAVKDDPARGIKAARDLAGTEIVKGYDFVDRNDFVFDGHGHGTHVAGTIAQTTNNRYGVAGLAHGAKIMPLRVLNNYGSGKVADIADSIRFAGDNGAHVINMSLGGPFPSLVMKRAIDHAHKKGVTIVAAAGNSGQRSPSYPAAYNHVIAVASTQFDKTTTFYSQYGDFVDIAAPGGNTRVDQNGDGRPDGVLQQTIKDGQLDKHDFLLFMGTSMASPHVAAGAAMVISQGVTNPDKVEAILKKTADTSQKKRFQNPKEYTERYGAGIMQADAAARKAVTDQGLLRLVLSLLASFGAVALVRRKDLMGLGVADKPIVFATAAVTGAGVFVLPLLGIGADCALVTALAHPLAELDLSLFGPGGQNPLLASGLVGLGAYALLGGQRRLRAIACGVALGTAGFCFAETLSITSDVSWIPGQSGALDHAWLLGNGALSMMIGTLGLKRS